MKKDRLMEYIFSIFLVVVLFFDLFVLNLFSNKFILGVFLLTYLTICRMYVKSRKIDSKNKKKIIFLMIAFSIVHLIFIYIAGIFVGFYKNPINFNIKELFKRILPICGIIILTELIRNRFINRGNKISTIIITIGLVLIDILMDIVLYRTINLKNVLTVVGYITLPSVSNNLLCNYIVKRHGYVPNILYRIIITIYMYCLPIIPDIYIFFHSVFKIIYPYFIYLMIDYAFTTDNFKLAVKNQKTNAISFIICLGICFAIVLLVSCKFRYGVMVVGSSSMAGSIDKGDAVLFEQYSGQELNEGQVIIFIKDDIQMIHRIQDIQILNGETIYYTKGDNNYQKDEGYRKEKDIIGVVKFKISYIGWPTIWVNQLFDT